MHSNNLGHLFILYDYCASVYVIYVTGQLSRDVIGCFKSNRWLSRDVIECWFIKSCYSWLQRLIGCREFGLSMHVN